MRPDIVVMISPQGQFPAPFLQRVEYLFIQQLIAQTAVKAFDKGVLLWLSRIDIVPWDGALVGPLQNDPAGELRPIALREAVLWQRIDLPRSRSVGLCEQSHTGLFAAWQADRQWLHESF